jgi:hypothetical protein
VVVFSDLVWVCKLQFGASNLANCVGKLSATTPWLHPSDQKLIGCPVLDDGASKFLRNQVFTDPSDDTAEFKRQFDCFWDHVVKKSVFRRFCTHSATVWTSF